GSGPAGQRAAVQAAKLGRRTAIVEKSRVLGGVCIDTGTIPSKTFREAVLGVARPGRRSEVMPGATRECRPTADQLFSRVGEVLRRECTVVERRLQRNDVDVLWGEGTFQDPH